MTFTLSARQVKISEQVKNFIEERVGRIEHYFGAIISAHVKLSAQKKLNRAEVIVHIGGRTVSASGCDADIRAAAEIAVERVMAQLKKRKGMAKRRHTAGAGRERIYTAVAETTPPVQKIFIRQMSYEVQGATATHTSFLKPLKKIKWVLIKTQTMF
ncbi:MAG: ribosome-associated translation inhibitor RaiA [Elusimicrobia bacterium]|nr:ribosome-associated translation inhibitor RaiA [Elusimicrobiota bacterium]